MAECAAHNDVFNCCSCWISAMAYIAVATKIDGARSVQARPDKTNKINLYDKAINYAFAA